jgi:hypothetical protein
MAGRAWLYVREDSSVWLQQAIDGETLLWIRGPGTHRRDYTFESVDEMLAFVSLAEERLRTTGWTGTEFGPGEDRRTTGSVIQFSTERRRATDRRTTG